MVICITSSFGTKNLLKLVEAKKEYTSSTPATYFSCGVLSARKIAVIRSSGAATAIIGFYFGYASFLSVVSLPNKGAGAKSLASAPDFFFVRPPFYPPPPPPSAGCCLGIVPSLLSWYQNILTMRQRRKNILTLCPKFSTTTLKIVGYSGSP